MSHCARDDEEGLRRVIRDDEQLRHETDNDEERNDDDEKDDDGSYMYIFAGKLAVIRREKAPPSMS